MFENFIEFARGLYPEREFVYLHAPVFLGREKEYLADCIDTTFVSYVGKYVEKFEEMTTQFTGARYAVAVVNGTAALQIAMQLAGVGYDDEVITQPLTFVATANAISHCGAKPVFIDVNLDTMGMSPESLSNWLAVNAEYNSHVGAFRNKKTKKRISAIVPMHTFGHPCKIDEISKIAAEYNLPLIEDSAESLGSYFRGKHTGTFGTAGVLSYNGNKAVTTGGGGMIITDDENLARKAKYITTTGKVPHKWEYVHDLIAYNFRLTNINAAIGTAQMEYINDIINNKRETAELYKQFFSGSEIDFIGEPVDTRSNYWLNSIKLKNTEQRNLFLEETNANNIMTRPVWRLMNKLVMYKDCQADNLANAEKLESLIVNIPSGYRV